MQPCRVGKNMFVCCLYIKVLYRILHIAKALRAYMRIDLRRPRRLVAQHLLDEPDVSPGLQQMRGKTVPQAMKGKVMVFDDLFQIAVKNVGHARG